jgi:uncharacterized protein (DUF427 family)
MTETDTHGSTRGTVRIAPSPKRVRAYLGGGVVADTLRPLLVWEAPYYPTYYIPEADVLAELVDSGTTERSPSRRTATVLDVRLQGVEAPRAASVYHDSSLEELRSHVRVAWTPWTCGWRRTSRRHPSS